MPESGSNDLWTISEDRFDPAHLDHKGTLFTIGNGYLSTRGASEESYPAERRATFVHGVFDGARLVKTELVNAVDWLPLTLLLDGERLDLTLGDIDRYYRALDLRNGLLTRTFHWRSPSGRMSQVTFERFASLANPHLLVLRCSVIPEFAGVIEFRAYLNGRTDNLGVPHLTWVDQGRQDQTSFLHMRTRQSRLDLAFAFQARLAQGEELSRQFWDAESNPCIVVRAHAIPGERVTLDKPVTLFTSRDLPAGQVVGAAVALVDRTPTWEQTRQENNAAWQKEWDRTDVVIEGDPEAQRAVRFNIYGLLIAAPRLDGRVSIGAKTLSGFGYRGHVFWDTEIFMLPLFAFTAPEIARNLLNYRYDRLPAARRKAARRGHEGALFAWESAETGEEVTPAWMPDINDRSRMTRIWTGEIEIHISADVAYAAHQYWQVTGDDAWFIDKGAELILDTAKFWASRAEWNAAAERYEYNNVIGPDEYHDHVNNNAYTNEMARWNLETALHVMDWLRENAPHRAQILVAQLDLTQERLDHWSRVMNRIYLPIKPSGLVEQFDGYFDLRDTDLATLGPRVHSTQQTLGIEETNRTQIIKQPDVLMLFFLLKGRFSNEIVKINYDYYTPRTDHLFGSSLGPSIQAIMACEVGQADEAYAGFWRAARADLTDARGNAGDGIHGASAGGTWQAIVFGFAGLRVSASGWTVTPRLPRDWKRLAFQFWYRGRRVQIDLTPDTVAERQSPVPAMEDRTG